MARKPKDGCEQFADPVKTVAGGDVENVKGNLEENFGTSFVEEAAKCHPEIVEAANQMGAALGISNIDPYIVISAGSAQAMTVKDSAKKEPNAEKIIYLASSTVDKGNDTWKFYLANALVQNAATIPPALLPTEAERKEMRAAIEKSIREAKVIKECDIKYVTDVRLQAALFDIVDARLAGKNIALEVLNSEHRPHGESIAQINKGRGFIKTGNSGTSADDKPQLISSTPPDWVRKANEEEIFDNPENPTHVIATPPCDLRIDFIKKYGQQVNITQLAAGTHVTPASTPPSMASAQNPDTPPKKPDNKPQR